MRIVWSDNAKSELFEHIRYIALHNKQAAQKQRILIQEAVIQLRSFPRRGRPGQIEGTRELIITHTPYLLVYGIHDDSIVIYHVYHGRQDWQNQPL